MTRDEAIAKGKGAQYWLWEEPETLYTRKNKIRYYPESKRLVFHLPDYYNTKLKEWTPGKGVGVYLDALKEDKEALGRLIEILSSLL